MENVLLYTFTRQPPCNFFLFFPRLHFFQLKTAHLHFTSPPPHHLRFSTTTTRSSRKWDTNAETIRAQKVNFNEDDDGEEEEDDEEEEEDESLSGNVKKKKRRWWSKKPRMAKKKSTNVFEEAIDSIWIFKVFKSFGWFSPAILISFLLATGPKAFLMALALPLALSVLYLAFEKLRGKAQRRTKRSATIKRKTSSRTVSSVDMRAKGEESQKTRKTKMENQAWMGSNNGPVNKDSQGTTRPRFGGWEHLDEEGSMQGTSEVISESKRTQKGKLSESGRRSDTPLLLRLLIALFPFIGFWAKMFW